MLQYLLQFRMRAEELFIHNIESKGGLYEKILGAKNWVIRRRFGLSELMMQVGSQNIMTAAWGGICCFDASMRHLFRFTKATYTFDSIIHRNA